MSTFWQLGHVGTGPDVVRVFAKLRRCACQLEALCPRECGPNGLLWNFDVRINSFEKMHCYIKLKAQETNAFCRCITDPRCVGHQYWPDKSCGIIFHSNVEVALLWTVFSHCTAKVSSFPEPAIVSFKRGSTPGLRLAPCAWESARGGALLGLSDSVEFWAAPRSLTQLFQNKARQPPKQQQLRRQPREPLKQQQLRRQPRKPLKQQQLFRQPSATKSRVCHSNV